MRFLLFRSSGQLVLQGRTALVSRLWSLFGLSEYLRDQRALALSKF